VILNNLTIFTPFLNNLLDNVTWYTYTVNGTPVLFTGNTDGNSTVTNTLQGYIQARYVRFQPQTWAGNGIGLRVECYTAPQLSITNPYNVAAVGNYVVHGHANSCSEVKKDTVSVSNPTQIPMHYRSRQNGNWTDLTTWQVYDSLTASWINAESYGPCGGVPYPTCYSLTIQVRDSVTYNFTIPQGIDETTIDPLSVHNSAYGGVIFIPSGITLRLVDSSITPIVADIQNNGRLVIQGNFTPIGIGLLVNSDSSAVAYVSNSNQTMWNGQYGKLEAKVGGLKTVSGTATLVRTDVKFLNAHIQLQNRSITLDTNCTITNGSYQGFFVTDGLGQVVKRRIGAGATTSFEFPVGPAASSYNKAILANSGTIDNFAVRVAPQFEYHNNFPGDELADTSSVNRTWFIDESVAGGSTVALDLFWITAHENANFDRTQSTVGHYLNLTGWKRLNIGSNAPGSGSNPDPWHQFASGITSFSPFSVGSCALVPLDYRTIADGNWTDLNIWEVWVPTLSQWMHAPIVPTRCGSVSYPTSLSRTVQVRHNVLYNYSIPIGVDQVTITSAGHLTVPANNNLILADGPGSDFATASNGIDIDNQGYFEITGSFTLQSNALLLNADSSIVHYNGATQTLWNGSYGYLYLDGPDSNAMNIKSVSGPNTQIRSGIKFINGKMLLGYYNCELLERAQVITPGQKTGYMIATSAGFCVWNYKQGSHQVKGFPIGGNTYSPCWIDFDSVITAGTLLGQVRETMHPTRYTIKRYWTMTLGSLTFDTNGYSAKFNYSELDLPVQPILTPNDEMIQVVQGGIYNPSYAEPGGWRISPNHIPNTIDINANTGTMRNNMFSDFTFMPINPPLPLDDIRLTAEWQGEDAILAWTMDEQPRSSLVYELLRSADMNYFDEVEMVLAEDGTTYYQYLDKKPELKDSKTLYYQVRRIDSDGNTKYSNTAQLSKQTDEAEFLNIYPNPIHFGERLNIEYFTQVEGEVFVELYDATGRFVEKRSYFASEGRNTDYYPIAHLSAGAYSLRFKTPNNIYNRKLVIIR
ncbi:MAG: T9SS type A sorting domain-containing protein, partial [Bacteroidia bacterium]|nr:T9SS type A sorting domain-containing protein [Bacteroidia bacterium]